MMMGCIVRLALLPVIIGVTYSLLSLRQPFPTFVFPAPGAEVAAPIAGFLDRPVRSCTLDEKLVEPGAEVSVAGIYSAAGKGIAPHPNDILKPFHIVPGGEASLDRKIRGKVRGAAISALLGLATIGVYAVMVARGLT